MLLKRAWVSCLAFMGRGRGDRGNVYVEYALLIALIAVICIAAVNLFGQRTQSSFSSTGSALEAVASG
ncbi:MAG: Flp family type IVb pilin [Acidimicrobiales bacterium]